MQLNRTSLKDIRDTKGNVLINFVPYSLRIILNQLIASPRFHGVLENVNFPGLLETELVLDIVC